MKELYQKNKHKIKSQHKERAEEIANYQKKYRLDNKEKLQKRKKEWIEKVKTPYLLRTVNTIKITETK